MTATAVRERPIIMTGESVRAILDGRKTQTRRAMKASWQGLPLDNPDYQREALAKCPYGVVGDRLWVRETFSVVGRGGLHERTYYAAAGDTPVDVRGDPVRWYSQIYMPRSLSRITLEITEVRVERVQSIRAADCVAEGIEMPGLGAAPTQDRCVARYRELWDSINAKRGYGWDVNPWVWCLTFRVVSDLRDTPVPSTVGHLCR